MHQLVNRRIFPLHLAPIDRFFLLEDRPKYPMTFASNLFFEGEIQRDALEDAFREARARHPLLSARLGRAKQGKTCWVDAAEMPTPVHWRGEEDSIPADHLGFNLRDEIGLRAWVWQGTGRSRLVLQFHHACADGTGAHRFIGDLLAAYGTRTAAAGDELPRTVAYDPQMLKARRHKLAKLETLSSASRLAMTGLKQLRQIYASRIAPVAVPGTNRHHDPTTEDAFPGVVSQTWDRQQHQALRAAANRQGAMLNDLLIAELFHTLQLWNERYKETSSRGRLRVMMPTDLRGSDDFQMPAANMALYTFITRRAKECRDAQRLLQSVRDETLLIKHEQRGQRFMESVMVTDYVPGLLGYLTKPSRSLATVTMSNMGDPTRRFLATFPRRQGKLVCGNLVLDRMLGVSPIRQFTRAAVSVVTMYRQLIINVRFDPAVMQVEHARSFLVLYAQRLSRHLEPGGSA